MGISFRPDGDAAVGGFGRLLRRAEAQVLQDLLDGCLVVEVGHDLEAGGAAFKVRRRYTVAETPTWAHLAVVGEASV